jgi:hypothetical protein
MSRFLLALRRKEPRPDFSRGVKIKRIYYFRTVPKVNSSVFRNREHAHCNGGAYG